jgi:hypothetical protein
MRRPPDRPFGPFYPPLLQPSVNHAERLAAVLEAAKRDARAPCPTSEIDEPEPAELWLTGRTSEIETFVAAVVDDWRRGIVSEEEASLALDRYVSRLHSGVRAHLTDGKPPACCVADDNTTAESEAGLVALGERRHGGRRGDSRVASRRMARTRALRPP